MIGLFSGLCEGMKSRGDLCLQHLVGYPDAGGEEGEVELRYTYARAAEGKETVQDVFRQQERTLWVVPRSVDWKAIERRSDMKGLFMVCDLRCILRPGGGGLLLMRGEGVVG